MLLTMYSETAQLEREKWGGREGNEEKNVNSVNSV